MHTGSLNGENERTKLLDDTGFFSSEQDSQASHHLDLI